MSKTVIYTIRVPHWSTFSQFYDSTNPNKNCRKLLFFCAVMFIVLGTVITCSMGPLNIGTTALSVGIILALGVGAWIIGCCCLKLGFQVSLLRWSYSTLPRYSTTTEHVLQAIRDHRNEMSADATRFRHRATAKELAAINKRFTAEDDTPLRFSKEPNRHVNFALAVNTIQVRNQLID